MSTSSLNCIFEKWLYGTNSSHLQVPTKPPTKQTNETKLLQRMSHNTKCVFNLDEASQTGPPTAPRPHGSLQQARRNVSLYKTDRADFHGYALVASPMASEDTRKQNTCVILNTITSHWQERVKESVDVREKMVKCVNKDEKKVQLSSRPTVHRSIEP